MNHYKSDRNTSALVIASAKMLKDKFDLSLSEDNIRDIVKNVSSDIISNKTIINKSLHELNNLTLLKIRNIYQSNKPKSNEEAINDSNGSNGSNAELLDDDLISSRLKELEIRRQIIPTYSDNEKDSSPKSVYTAPILKPNPISITIPSTIENKKKYKTFIINSINRDWEKNSIRNNIKFNITLDFTNNVVFPQCICFPKFVKNLSPYVLMNICDGVSNVYISFTCSQSSSQSKWDVWTPVDDVENIALSNKTWLIRFFDFTNNELDLGKDAQNILQVTADGDNFHVNISPTDNQYEIGDLIKIKTYSGNYVTKKIINYVDDNDKVITICNDSNQLTLDDFINSKIMNLSDQYSFIIKYHYKA